MRTESQQVYYVPHNNNPDLVFVKYSMLKPKYMTIKPKERFDLSNLPKKEVTYREF